MELQLWERTNRSRVSERLLGSCGPNRCFCLSGVNAVFSGVCFWTQVGAWAAGFLGVRARFASCSSPPPARGDCSLGVGLLWLSVSLRASLVVSFPPMLSIDKTVLTASDGEFLEYRIVN